MSLTSEENLELLEAYLDGELTTSEEESLRARMSAEPSLAATMQALRAGRSVRAEAWKSFEPAPAQVERLMTRVHASVDRNTIWAARLSKLRVVTSAAASRIDRPTAAGRACRAASPTSGRPGRLTSSRCRRARCRPPASPL